MNEIEIIAAIFSICILAGTLVVLLFPKYYSRVAKSVMKNLSSVRLFFVLLIAIVGYFVLTNVPIVTIAAVTFFAGMLAKLTFASYDKEIKAFSKEIMKRPDQMIKRAWFPWLAWVAIAIWTLWALYK